MCALSSADRVPGYEPVGQRFESSRARQKKPLRKKWFFQLSVPCGTISTPSVREAMLRIVKCLWA